MRPPRPSAALTNASIFGAEHQESLRSYVHQTGSGGALVKWLEVYESGRVQMPLLPTCADDTAAGAGGLLAGDLYKTAAGDLRIKV